MLCKWPQFSECPSKISKRHFASRSHHGSYHRRSAEGVSTLSSPKKLVCSGCAVKNFIFGMYYPASRVHRSCDAKSGFYNGRRTRALRRDAARWDFSSGRSVFSESTRCTLHCCLLVLCWLLSQWMPHAVENESDVYATYMHVDRVSRCRLPAETRRRIHLSRGAKVQEPR